MRIRLLFLVIMGLVATVAPAASAAESFRDCADCPLMVAVPAGSYSMGSTDEQINWAVGLGAQSQGIQDEKPQHQVNVGSFSMSSTEVTRTQFANFVAATGFKVGDCLYPKGND